MKGLDASGRSTEPRKKEDIKVQRRRDPAVSVLTLGDGDGRPLRTQPTVAKTPAPLE